MTMDYILMVLTLGSPPILHPDEFTENDEGILTWIWWTGGHVNMSLVLFRYLRILLTNV
jgi:hypothetical protein